MSSSDTRRKATVTLSAGDFMQTVDREKALIARHVFSVAGRPVAGDRFFGEFSNIKFNENPSSGGRVVSCGQTDRHDEVNSRFSQFCERA